MDGSLVVYDKEKEDAQFNPEEEAVNGNISGSSGEAIDATNGTTHPNGIRINNPAPLDLAHLADLLGSLTCSIRTMAA
ncbi:hypothetical protein CEP52_012900 [Fusarium oligoseptatum]|uniref:Uncharacterized protein n=1 Tax=Fusarium oligoseptatum TaxID=2604345 RepID=A0A428SW20_9HYPO|nr:hypothetical protein CEP52_012900 [Fusarium oligoseptatum]